MSLQYGRRNSNDIAASVRLGQLRTLQNQLAGMIQDTRTELPFDYDMQQDEEAPPSPINMESKSLNHSERTAFLDAMDHADEYIDVESGLSSQTTDNREEHEWGPSDLPRVHRPSSRRQSMLPSIDTSDVITADTRAPTLDTTGTESMSGTESLDLSQHSRGSRRRMISAKRLFGRRSAKAEKTLPQMLPFADENKEESSLRPDAKWWHWVYLFSLVSMVACIVTLWAPSPIGARQPSSEVAASPWSNGCKDGLETCICPRATICADDLLSMIFLTIARASAWFDYPLYMLLFLSKANNLNQALQKTALRVFINFSDYHKVHSLFGIVVALESTSHTFFHILRWARRQNDIRLLWTTNTGITGMIAFLLLPIIVLPMTLPFLKKRMTFEWRKFLHYFSILWAVALMHHAPQRIFWMIGVPLFIYVSDKLVEGMFKTHLIESCHFQRLGDTSCLIEFENPVGFGKQNSAYVYVMLPWISKYQFHAFTVFPSTKPNHSSICIYKSGDWTSKLHNNISVPAHKPAFIVGPFLSPFSSPAMDSENLVAVASGIGVTPAISLIRQYSSTSRRLNLVWICRDAGLIEHFISNVDFSNNGYTLIYYTGKVRALILKDKLPANVLIFNGRPDLERTISGIVHAIASGKGLPEECCSKIVTRTPADVRSKLLIEKALSLYTMDQLYDYTTKASNYYKNEGQEPLTDMVNYQGMLSTMRHLLGEDAGLVEKKILRNFEQVDDEGQCLLNRIQFDEFFDLMLLGTKDEAKSIANLRLGLEKVKMSRDIFNSSNMTKSDESGDEFHIKKYLHGNGKFSADKWSVLYCGGSEPIQRQLKAYRKKYGVPLSVEKFDW